MRILWLTVDRSARLGRGYYDTLQAAVAKREDVRFIRRELGKSAGKWCKEQVFASTAPKVEPLVTHEDAEWADVVFTDAPWAFLDEAWRGPMRDKPRCCLLTDMHGEMVRQYVGHGLSEAKYTTWFVRYRDAREPLLPDLWGQDVRWLPLEIDPGLMRSYDLPRRNVALLTGQVNSAYPVRQAILRDCVHRDWFRWVARSNDGPGAWPAGEDYARLLSEHVLGLGCMSVYGYPLLKLLEIPATGAALACDATPELYDLGFEPGVNFYELDSRTPMRRQITDILGSDDIELVAAAGQELVHSRHTAEIRAGELVAQLQGMV